MASVSHARSASPVARATRSMPGVCLGLALAMAAQCAAVPVLLRRARPQEGSDVSSARVA